MDKIGLTWIVDDDKLYQFTMQKTVDKTNLVSKIMAFFDGKAAIDNLIANQHDTDQIPDLIFLDINMPIMDGWEFLERYMKLKPSLAKEAKIFLISSSIDTSDKVKAHNIEGITDILVKPIGKEHCMDIFRRYLDTH